MSRFHHVSQCLHAVYVQIKKMQNNTKRLRYSSCHGSYRILEIIVGTSSPSTTQQQQQQQKNVYGSPGKPGGELRGDMVPPDSVHIESVDIGLSKTPIVTPVIVQELRRFIVIVFNNVTQKVFIFLENALYVLRPKMIRPKKSNTLWNFFFFFPPSANFKKGRGCLQ